MHVLRGRGSHLLSPALVAGARDLGALPARAIMVAVHTMVVKAHDRLRRLRHMLRGVRWPRGSLEIVMRRIQGAHLVRMRGASVYQVGALLQLLEVFA